MQSNGFSYEILFIDDGSTDQSWQTIETLQEKDNNVKGIRFLKNFGKSQALHAGFAKAKAMLLLQWMPICRIIQTKYQTYTT